MFQPLRSYGGFVPSRQESRRVRARQEAHAGRRQIAYVTGRYSSRQRVANKQVGTYEDLIARWMEFIHGRSPRSRFEVRDLGALKLSPQQQSACCRATLAPLGSRVPREANRDRANSCSSA
jgi:hypothetical protein